MQAIRRILVAIKNPKARSLPAVVKAAQLARALGAEMELFHAIDAPLYLDVTDFRGGQSVKQLESDWRKQRLRQLDRAARRVSDAGLKVTTAVEWDYPSYAAVIRRARQIRADLIVANAMRDDTSCPGCCA